MSARYLLDTDWVIHYLDANPAVAQRADECRAEGLAVSIFTVAGLYGGVFGADRRPHNVSGGLATGE